MGMRRVVVGFSGGVTSAWCAGWALRNFPREEVVLLWHDTKAEHPDTYRFLSDMEKALGMERTERSDGRTLEEVVRDEGMIPNNRAAFCSRILKQEQGNKYIRELQEQGATEIIRVMGFSANEPDRIQRQTAITWQQTSFFCEVTVIFPLVIEGVSKQQCADWCSCEMGVVPSSQYEDFDHANCEGCWRGKYNYWAKVAVVSPQVFARRAAQEREVGHSCLPDVFLDELSGRAFKPSARKESIEIGPCECGS
jgi:hypothetical protein